MLIVLGFVFPVSTSITTTTPQDPKYYLEVSIDPSFIIYTLMYINLLIVIITVLVYCIDINVIYVINSDYMTFVYIVIHI